MGSSAGVCVCLLCTNRFMRVWMWGWLGTPCLLILTEWLISANWEGQFKQAQRSGCHTSVTWVQRDRQWRLLQPSLFPQTQPSLYALQSTPPPLLIVPGSRPGPAELSQSGALCLDGAISSQPTSEKRTGQGSGQRLRQKHGCLWHLGSQQLTEGPIQRRSCWSMICIE